MVSIVLILIIQIHAMVAGKYRFLFNFKIIYHLFSIDFICAFLFCKFPMALLISTVTSDEDRANHILLLTVINPAYPITCVS